MRIRLRCIVENERGKTERDREGGREEGDAGRQRGRV
jgi:hypothetical protein